VAHGSSPGEKPNTKNDKGTARDNGGRHALAEEERCSDDHQADGGAREDWVGDSQAKVLQSGCEAEEICCTQSETKAEVKSPENIMRAMSDAAKDRVCAYIQRDRQGE